MRRRGEMRKHGVAVEPAKVYWAKAAAGVVVLGFFAYLLAKPSGGLPIVLAVAACFIGGAAVTGGAGKISGAMIGALIRGVLNIGLSILAVDPSWQMTIKGLVLLAAVAFDLVCKKRGAAVA
ncbi:hypothetical protein ACT3SQ_07945 [Brachybacterium sp. AOP42-C2-15]|uniref:hypothetical protein n=2 Tax=Brachybacterium TaxID=43668 RepID=UPI0040333EA0